MSTLVASKTIHEFSLQEIKTVLAKDLGIDEYNVTVEFIHRNVADECSRFPRMEVTSLRVTIDHTANKPTLN